MAYRIDWTGEIGQLIALEPEPAEIMEHAGELALGYNEPANAALMGHTEPIAPADVVAHYLDMAEEGARQFLLFANGQLAGDADLRGFHGGAAEFAFMIGARTQQGKGLGTRFALMIHAFGFRQLSLARIYASVVPHNTASLRVFEKLGYAVDDSAEARSFADEPGDVVLALDLATFEARHADALAQIRISSR